MASSAEGKNARPLHENVNIYDPFTIHRVTSFSRKFQMKSIVDRKKNLMLVYSLGNIITIFNPENFEHVDIMDHEEEILKLDYDKTGRFLVSCDKKYVAVWHLKENLFVEKPIPLRILAKTNGEFRTCAISTCGKFLVTASENFSADQYDIEFWLWSFGSAKGDGAASIPTKKYGTLNTIVFSENENENNFFAITFTNTVIFGTWESVKEELHLHYPDAKFPFELVTSCYAPFSRFVATCSKSSRILIWSDVLVNDPSKPVTNEKQFLKQISLQLEVSAVNDIRPLDGYTMTVDNFGELKFYDSDFRLTYYCAGWRFDPILNITPTLLPRNYVVVQHGRLIDSEDELKEQIPYETCPRVYTGEQGPFVVRNFFLVTITGKIIFCDIVQNFRKMLQFYGTSPLAAIDHHPNGNIVLLYNVKGKFTVYDYEKMQVIKQYLWKNSFPKSRYHALPKCTALKVSPCGTFFACGFETGWLILMHLFSGDTMHKHVLEFSHGSIERIKFGFDAKFLAYCDSNNTVVILHNKDNVWELAGKNRYHYGSIVELIFYTLDDYYYLATIGSDRYFAEYEIQGIGRESVLTKEECVPNRSVRMEQSARITAATLLSSIILEKDTSTNGTIILTANDQGKLRIYDLVKMEILFTYLGPFLNAPIDKIIFKDVVDNRASRKDQRYLIISSGRMIAVAVPPLDGNPFRYSATCVTPKKIINMCAPENVSKVVTLGEDSHGIIVWIQNERNNLRYLEIGGEGLEPFCSLLPGGKHGWFFEEIQNYFYLFQLMRDKKHLKDFVPIESIEINDIMNFMRSLGYFPTEWEIENINKEVLRTPAEWMIPSNRIPFMSLVKLYINHKSTEGYKLADINKALEYFINLDLFSQGLLVGAEQVLPVELLLTVLSEMGEPIPREEAMKMVLNLWDKQEAVEDSLSSSFSDTSYQYFSELPSGFTVLAFCRELLGLNVKHSDDGRLISVFADEYKDVMQNGTNYVLDEEEEMWMSHEAEEGEEEGIMSELDTDENDGNFLM